MPPITQYGSFTQQIANQINQNINAASVGFIAGNVILLDPFAGRDTNDGLNAPVQSLFRAYSVGREGKNDVIALISNGLTTSSARLAANFTWAKNALHLVGVSSGVNISNRSRIAPKAATPAFANFFTVSGSGCLFQNIEFFQGFDTGVAASICLTVTGGRNMFANCHIAGMGDTVSAQSSTSRDLRISGTGENLFINCTIGLDTVSSNTTNASFELAGGTVRNQFTNCTFLRYTSSAGTLIGVVAAAAGIDRETMFNACKFINAIGSGSTVMSAAFTLAASAGGLFVMDPLCQLVGISAFGTNATSLAQIYVGGAAVSSGAGKSVASA